MNENVLHCLAAAVGAAAIALQPRPADRWGETTISAVLPGTVGESTVLEVVADDAQRCCEVGAVGGELGDVHRRWRPEVGWGDLYFAFTSRRRGAVTTAGTRLGSSYETRGEVVDLIEIVGFEDHEGEFDEEVIAVVGAEATVHSGAESPRERLEEDRSCAGVLGADRGTGSNDPICVCEPFAVPDGHYECSAVRVAGKFGVPAYPAGGERAIVEMPILGAELLLEGGHGVPSVDGDVRSTVRIAGPGFGPGSGPDVRIRPRLPPPGCPACGPGSSPRSWSRLTSAGAGR
jgi:hypothetical protein